MLEQQRALYDQRIRSGDAHDAEYYASHCGPIPYERSVHWLEFFGAIANQIVHFFQPRRVFDAGCALGFLVEALHDRGVDAWGVDISEHAISNVRPDIQGRCQLGSVTDPIANGPFDLVTCIEVLEHVSEPDSHIAIEQITRVTDTILFSSTPEDFAEPTHINVRSTIYWLRLFAAHEFYPDTAYDASFIAPHALLLRRQSEQMPEQMLVLFCEVLRGRSYRAAFLTRHNRIETLEYAFQKSAEEAAQRGSDYKLLLARDNGLKDVVDALGKHENALQTLHCDLAAAQQTLGHAVELFDASETLRRDLNAALQVSCKAFEESAALREVIAGLSKRCELLSHIEAELFKARGELWEALSTVARVPGLEQQVEILQGQLARTEHLLSELEARNGDLTSSVAAYEAQKDHWKQTEAELLGAQQEIAALRQQLRKVEEDLGAALLSTYWLMGLLRYMSQAEIERQAREQEEQAVRQRETQSNAHLRFQLEESRLEAAHANALYQEWLAHATEMSCVLDERTKQLLALQTDLEALQASPGWRLIFRYREWLQATRARHAPAVRVWESALFWLLRRLKIIPARPERRVGIPRVAPSATTALPKVTFSATYPPSVPPAQKPESRESDYDAWISENEPDAIQLEIQRRVGRSLPHRPKISIVTPVYKVPLAVLKETIDSVLAQTYDNWELCAAVTEGETPEVLSYLEGSTNQEPRIKVTILKCNEGIAGNSNAALALATGEHLALLDHDDTLAPFALYEAVQLLNSDRSADFIYSDKDQISADGQHRLHPLFKPSWSPEVMLNANYLTHLCVMRTEHVRQIGGWRTHTDGAQDWDLFLRLATSCHSIRHIPKVLYHWRQLPTSVSAKGLEAKPYAAEAQVRSVTAYLAAIGLTCGVSQNEGMIRIKWPKIEQKTSIILLSQSAAADVLSRAHEIARVTDGDASFEILVGVAPESTEANDVGPVRSVMVTAGATLLDRINILVRSATGDQLVFIDEAVLPVAPDWLHEITGPLQLPNVAVVGAKILNSPTGALRHCGIVFTNDGRAEYVYRGQPEHVFAEAGGANWYRNWSAVSGACMALKRAVWTGVDGMADTPKHPRLDIHFCLKVRHQTDHRILYNPYARVLQTRESQFELTAYAPADAGTAYIKSCFPNGDPYFSPHLDCVNGAVTLRQPRKDVTEHIIDYTAESRALVDIYDAPPDQLVRSKKETPRYSTAEIRSITWFLPEFSTAFYGGVHTVLRFADGFLRAHGVRSHICVLGHTSERHIRSLISSAFPKLGKESTVSVRPGYTSVADLPSTDAAVCSLWTTAYAALHFSKARRKFYFIQDDEAMFYPAGSTSALVEATYGFGFHGICNTEPLLRCYTARGGHGEYFNPCIDPAVFYPDGRRPISAGKPYTLFWYARPSHPRNCFELLSAAVRLAKRRLGDHLLVISAGAEWDTKRHGLEGIVHNLGLLSYQSTGALYRTCDSGLVMMMTRHPSYLPLELMGCGSLVISNSNVETTWLLHNRENCLLADLNARDFADRIEEGLKDAGLRQRITGTATDLVRARYSTWNEQIDKIYRYMERVC